MVPARDTAPSLVSVPLSVRVTPLSNVLVPESVHEPPASTWYDPKPLKVMASAPEIVPVPPSPVIVPVGPASSSAPPPPSAVPMNLEPASPTSLSFADLNATETS